MFYNYTNWLRQYVPQHQNESGLEDDEMKEKYTENEKLLLEMLFEIADTMASNQGGYLDFTARGEGYMSESDIYNLRCKLEADG